MRASFSNFRSSNRWQQRLLVCALVISLSGLAGVPLLPLISEEGLRTELADLRAREAERLVLVRELEAFEAHRGWERTHSELRALRGLLPQDVAPLEVHALLRVAASARGFTLRTIEIQDPVPSAHADCREARANLVGIGALDGLLAALRALRVAGYPVAVTRAAVTRAADGSGRYEAELDLLLFCRTEASTSAAAEDEEH